MTIRALLASTCLATVLGTAATAFAQDSLGSSDVREIDAVYYVTWLEATVREAPSTGSAAVAEVYMGDRIYVTGEVIGTEWVRIAFDDGTSGYMWSGVLAPAMVGAPAAPSTDGGQTGGGTATEQPQPDGAGNSIYDAYEIGNADSTDVSFSDHVSSTDLDDYYAIDVTDWTYVDLALEGLTGDADLMLVDEYETIIGSSEVAGPGSEYVQQTVPAGRYYVRVTSYEGDTDYTLYLYTEPTTPPPPDTVGNTMEEASPIESPTETGQTLYERLDLTDRDDWYSFTVADFTEVTAYLSGLGSDLDLEIVDADGNQVAISDNGGNTEEQTVAVVGPGTHFIHVYIYAGQSDYTLDVSGVPSAPPPPDNAGNSVDNAADLGTLDATAAPDGLTATDWVGSGDLDDYFSFTVTAATTIEARLTGLVGDLDLELLGSDGAIVSVSNNSGNAEEMVGLSVEPGTYYLHVYAFDGNSDFTLTVKEVPAP
ncbi:MAG: pre-peptidase C-terminal domain-containing protein [Alphaproteobacteria bacterium]